MRTSWGADMDYNELYKQYVRITLANGDEIVSKTDFLDIAYWVMDAFRVSVKDDLQKHINNLCDAIQQDTNNREDK